MPPGCSQGDLKPGHPAGSPSSTCGVVFGKGEPVKNADALQTARNAPKIA